MATYEESEIFAQEPVASASTKDVESLEDDKLREYVYNRIGNVGNTISEHDIGVLIKHHCGNRLRKKTALLTLPYVINANYIIRPWRRQTNNGEIIKGKDKRLSGMVGAPILIDGIKYLCNISLKKSANGKVRPYALTLKDGNGNIVENEKMDSTLQVPDSNSEPTTSGNAHFDKVTTSPDTNPSTDANIDKNNKTNKNESKNMNKKNTIRLTESDLKRVISESVKKVLKEQLDGNATDNPMINQLWNELMSINRGLIKEVLQKYGWGKSKELGDGVFKQIVKVSEAINTFDAVLRNTTADSDYWSMNAHEQD